VRAESRHLITPHLISYSTQTPGAVPVDHKARMFPGAPWEYTIMGGGLAAPKGTYNGFLCPISSWLFFAKSTPSKPRDGGCAALRDDGEGPCSEAQAMARVALYGAVSRVNYA
jgi:hypothetical protein